MTPSLHKHQRKMHSRTGATSMGGGYGRASIPVAHDELQDWPALRGRAGFHGCCTSLLTGAGFNRSAHFSRFMCCAHSPQFERRRRQVGADVLPRTRSVATKFLRDLKAAAAGRSIGRALSRSNTSSPNHPRLSPKGGSHNHSEQTDIKGALNRGGRHQRNHLHTGDAEGCGNHLSRRAHNHRRGEALR